MCVCLCVHIYVYAYTVYHAKTPSRNSLLSLILYHPSSLGMYYGLRFFTSDIFGWPPIFGRSSISTLECNKFLLNWVFWGNNFAPDLPPIRLWGGLFSVTTWAVAGRVDSGRPWREDWKFDCLDLLVVVWVIVWGLCYLWWKRDCDWKRESLKTNHSSFLLFSLIKYCFGQCIHVSDDLLHHAGKNHIQISKSVANWFPIDGNNIQETLVFHSWLIAYCTRFLFFLGIKKAIII